MKNLDLGDGDSNAELLRAERQGSSLVSSSGYRCSCLEPTDVAKSEHIRAQWEQLVQTSANPYAFYQSPVWWDHVLLEQGDGERCVLVMAHQGDGTLAGIVPVQTCPYTLKYGIRSRTLCKMQIHVVKILGSQPLVLDDKDLYVELIRCLLSAFPDCDGIEMQNVLVDSDCGRMICNSQDLRQSALVYLPEEMTNLHLITMPESFEGYLGKFKSKSRYNLRRQVKRLRERGTQQLDLVRVEHETDVEEFLDVAARLSSISRQYQRVGWQIENNLAEYQKLVQLANAGVLRSYYLRCGDEIFAYVKGFQYNGIFYYSQPGFDERYSEYSPGTVLLYLLIEDLFSHRRPDRVHLCGGDFLYKSRFETDQVPNTRVLLLRRSLSNYLRAGSHAAFRSSVGVVKRLLCRKRP